MIVKHLKQAAVAVQGIDHINRQIECQDCVSSISSGGVNVIALADGAGSRTNSKEGAELISECICKDIANNFNCYYELCEKTGKTEAQHKADIDNLKEQLLKIIIAQIASNVVPPESIDDYAATLLFFACRKDKYICGHIGDGVIGILNEHFAGVDVRSAPENGGAPNITFFATDANAKDHFRIEWGDMKGIEGVILMSDGPEEVLYERDTGLSDNTSKIITNFRAIAPKDYESILKKFLSANIAQFSYDDLSVNILYFETVDLDSCSEEYWLDCLKNIENKNQIVRCSQFAVSLEDYNKYGEKDFNSSIEALNYLRGMK